MSAAREHDPGETPAVVGAEAKPTRAGAVGSTCDRCGDCVDPLTLEIVGVPAQLVCADCAGRLRGGQWKGAVRAGIWADGLGGVLGVAVGLGAMGLSLGPLGTSAVGLGFVMLGAGLCIPIIAVVVGLLLTGYYWLRGGLPHGPRPLIERAARTASWGVGLLLALSLIARALA